MTEPDLLTLEEVAGRLRIGQRTVERFVHDGELRSVKIGRRRFGLADEIDRFLRQAERRGRVA